MATTTITVAETPIVDGYLRLADDALIHGHRLSEWTGHAPTLEEELALANIALDLIGQARSLYQAAGALCGRTEDELAYLRDQHQFRNALIMELPRGDFAFTITRLLLSAAAADLFWRDAARANAPGNTPGNVAASADPDLAAIAAKAVKETAYHVRHAAEWLIRLGDGTEESHRRAQDALDTLWPYSGELETPSRDAWLAVVAPVIARATLALPTDGWMQSGGREGRHTEHLGHLLAEMQVLPRTFPGAVW
jgi:ring-1,2-phenylacetyl-CoA epoxidase subunit PaaC